MDEFEQQAQSRVGSVVDGKWHLASVLGVGGMAGVYLAHDAGGREVAVKILHAEINSVSEAQKRFIREVEINNQLLNHGARGVVRVLETGVDAAGVAYAVMERLHGEELNDHLRRVGRMPIEAVMKIAGDALQVLEVAHGLGVVHRDLKPENLFLDASGHLRVLDFGLARILDAVPDSIQLPDKTATKSGIILGTAAYMSPEQAIGVQSEIDVRTDIYSLAATLFRALAGRTVHGPLPLTQQVVAAATQPAPPIQSVAPDVPSPIAAAIDRGLAFRKEERFLSCQEFRAALLGNSPMPAVSVPSVPATTTSSSQTVLWIMILMGGVMLVVAAFVATLLFTR